MENRKINILGTEYRIETHKISEDKCLKENKFCGYCAENECLIVVADTSEEKYFSDMNENERETYWKKILRHEIIHAFFNESGLQSSANQFDGAWVHNEEMIDWFAIQSPKIFKVYSELGLIDAPIPNIPPLQTGSFTNAGATEALKNVSEGIRKAAETAKRAGMLNE